LVSLNFNVMDAKSELRLGLLTLLLHGLFLL
jgi:hypothetical protein